jgi:phosphoribosyl 1,2-cyclic phosphodiesterase
MFFSHCHWDHIQGFPFFGPAFVPSTTLYVYSADPGQARLRELLSGQMNTSYFPVKFSELGARIEQRTIPEDGGRIGDIQVRYFALEHPGSSFAFGFERAGTRVVYATDNEIDRTFPDAGLVERDLAAPRPIPDALVSFVRGADLLIGDGQYTDEEYPTKRGWGHSRATTLVDLAVRAEVKQLAIYHHDPMHTDDDLEAIVAACRERAAKQGSALSIFGAREGFELKLG